MKKHITLSAVLLTLILGLTFCGQKDSKNPIYKIVIPGGDFNETTTMIEMAIKGANMRIISTLDLKKGLESRGENFPNYKVYQFCNLTKGMKVFKKVMDFGAYIPCKIFVYQKDKDIVVGTFLPTSALEHFGVVDNETKKLVLEIEDEIISMIKGLKG
ncbi:MAG: DUF302 domain-containing protein [Spirochaetota bacterium]|nr:DUF302 domain-containing protein [Spirochaetota bacterium]